MNQRSPLSPAGKATVAALLVAAVGFLVQILSGVDVPTVPPGLLLVGFFASGSVGSLLDPGRLGVLVGAWVQFLALIVAVVAGIVAIVQNFRVRKPA